MLHTYCLQQTGLRHVSASVVNIIQMQSVYAIDVECPSSTSESTKALNLLDTFRFSKNRPLFLKTAPLPKADASNCKAKSTKLVIVGSRHLASQLPCFEYFWMANHISHHFTIPLHESLVFHGGFFKPKTGMNLHQSKEALSRLDSLLICVWQGAITFMFYPTRTLRATPPEDCMFSASLKHLFNGFESQVWTLPTILMQLVLNLIELWIWNTLQMRSGHRVYHVPRLAKAAVPGTSF